MGIRVLFADPEQPLLVAYEGFFVRAGFDVATVASGLDCARCLVDWDPDVLVLEPDMPDGWGERIALMATDQEVPLLILSRIECFRSTAVVTEYHVKPKSMHTVARSVCAAARRPTNGRGPVC